LILRLEALDERYIAANSLALARLLDRVLILDKLIPENLGGPNEFRFIWEDPDGSEHDTPYWERHIIDHPVTLEDGTVWTPPVKNRPPNT
jgi:hypothetical protein